MTIQQLQYALAVYRAGSISAAAASLFIAQPNLSGVIRSLEEELGYPIFIRTSRGVQPTEQGLEALRQAAQIVDCHEKMCQVGSLTPRRRLRIGGISYNPVCDAFAQLCKEYQNEDGLEMAFYTDDIDVSLEKLWLSEIDLAVALRGSDETDRLEKICRQKNLKLTHMADVPMVLRIGPRHPLYSAPEIRFSDFENYAMVDYNDKVFLEYPSLSALLHINPDRIVTVSDRALKNRLISETSMYSIGCKLPPRSNERFGFRCIPLDNLHYSLFVMERYDSRRGELTVQYLNLLERYLEDL